MSKYERTIEASWPYVAGTLVLCLVFWPLGSPFPKPAAPLLSASETAAAVVVGFLATAKAVMLSVASSPTYQRLKESGFTGPLFRYLFEAIWIGIVFIIFSTIGFFLDSDVEPLPWWYMPIWVWLASTLIFLFVRIAQIIFLLLKQI